MIGEFEVVFEASFGEVLAERIRRDVEVRRRLHIPIPSEITPDFLTSPFPFQVRFIELGTINANFVLNIDNQRVTKVELSYEVQWSDEFIKDALESITPTIIEVISQYVND